MRHNRATFLERKNLFTKHQLVRSPFSFLELGADAAGTIVDQFRGLRDAVKVDQLKQIRQGDLVLQQILYLCLPFDLFDLPAFCVKADLVDLIEPLLGRQLGVGRQEIGRAKMIEQRYGQERLDGALRKIAPR